MPKRNGKEMPRADSEIANRFEACGKVIDTGIGRNGYPFIRLVIKVGERRIVIENGVRRDETRKAFVNFRMDKIPSDIRVTDYVKVNGYISANSYYNDELRRYMSFQEFIVTDIRHNESELSQQFGQKGKYVTESYFRAYLKGYVRSAVKNGEWRNLVIEVPGGGEDKRTSMVRAGYYASKSLPPFDYKNGDEVCLYAGITTSNKIDDNGVERHYENLVIEDIVKIEKDPPEKKASDVAEGTELPIDDIDEHALL